MSLHHGLMHWRRCLTLLFVAVTLCACNEVDQAAAISKQGIAFAQSLQTFYGQLQQDLMDTLEMEAFDGGIRGTSMSAPAIKTMEDTIASLKQRQDMAKALETAYTTLGSLAGSNAPGEVKTATDNLVAAAEKVTKMPGSNTGDLLAAAGAELVRLKKASDIKEANKAFAPLLAKIRDYLNSEKTEYSRIWEERNTKVKTVTDKLIDDELVASTHLLDRFLQGIDLPWKAPLLAFNTPPTKAAAKALVKLRFTRMQNAADTAFDALSQALDKLVKQHQALDSSNAREALDKLSASTLIAKANHFLDIVDKLRPSR